MAIKRKARTAVSKKAKPVKGLQGAQVKAKALEKKLKAATVKVKSLQSTIKKLQAAHLKEKQQLCACYQDVRCAIHKIAKQLDAKAQKNTKKVACKTAKCAPKKRVVKAKRKTALKAL